MSYPHFLMQLYGKLPEEARDLVILGGGALRAYYDKTPIRDIDCFFRSPDEAEAVVQLLRETPGWTELPPKTGTANFRSPCGFDFNLVLFLFETPVGHLLRFDLRCCAHVAVHDAGMINHLSAPDAVPDAVQRLLFVLNNNGTDRTVRRIRHYIEDYGYSLHPDQDFDDDYDHDPYPGHAPQGVPREPSPLPEPDYMGEVRRRVRRLPVSRYNYPE